MGIRTKVNFYRIDECGYYRRGERILGGVGSLLNDLHDFVTEDRPIVTTKVFDIEPDREDPMLPVYIYATHRVPHSPSDMVVVSWNRTADTEGQVASIDPEEPTGEADVDFVELPPGNLPGYASYFWFVPEEEIFATLRFGNRTKNGHRGLKRYLRGYLATKSGLLSRQVTANSTDISLPGTVEDELDEGSITTRFDSSRVRGRKQEEFLRENVDRIYRIIQRNDISHERRITDESVWEAGLRAVGLQEVRSFEDHHKYELTTDYEPSAEELDAIIDNWHTRDHASYDNVGFVLQGESSKTYWLSDALAKSEYELPIGRQNDEIVEPEELARTLGQRRNAIMNECLPD